MQVDYLPAELPGKPRDYSMTKTHTHTHTKNNSKQALKKKKKGKKKIDSLQLTKEVRGHTLMHLVIMLSWTHIGAWHCAGAPWTLMK